MPRGYPQLVKRTLTPSRREWLQKLTSGPLPRGNFMGSAPAHCLLLGWTEKDGNSHRLTDSGRKVLGQT